VCITWLPVWNILTNIDRQHVLHLLCWFLEFRLDTMYVFLSCSWIHPIPRLLKSRWLVLFLTYYDDWFLVDIMQIVPIRLSTSGYCASLYGCCWFLMIMSLATCQRQQVVQIQIILICSFLPSLCSMFFLNYPCMIMLQLSWFVLFPGNFYIILKQIRCNVATILEWC
jgi:hypothetical protein